jgi:xanthosine utilization system XapX-like protein
LRTFARTKDTALLPPYEANTLFGNVDSILTVNQAFLYDLEQMVISKGQPGAGGIGDVALKHVRFGFPPTSRLLSLCGAVQGSQSVRLLQAVLCEKRGSASYFKTRKAQKIIHRFCGFHRRTGFYQLIYILL